MKGKYENPPIIEALCEFRFAPSQQWDITIPGILYQQIRESFPIKKQKKGFGIGLKPTEEGVEVANIPPQPPMMFYSEDERSLVQIQENVMTINQLRPYCGWDELKPVIIENLKKYCEVAKPKGFNQIILRYINKIDIPKKNIELEDYFQYYPFLPKDLPQTLGKFNVKIEIPYEEQRDLLVLILAAVPPEKPDSIPIILDLIYIMITPESIAIEDVEDWMNTAHDRIIEAFEACITDKSREIFREAK